MGGQSNKYVFLDGVHMIIPHGKTGLVLLTVPCKQIKLSVVCCREMYLMHLPHLTKNSCTLAILRHPSPIFVFDIFTSFFFGMLFLFLLIVKLWRRGARIAVAAALGRFLQLPPGSAARLHGRAGSFQSRAISQTPLYCLFMGQ